ncbi:MAG TPA: GNAT family N-acetyltransferase [Pyrinomonadaceae bacterium]|nr:GNAT family N-acetyltransferase [Pyrinomonadaceae bacterium]
MKVTVEKIGPQDIKVLLGLIEDFAAFEEMQHTFTVTEQTLHEVLFGKEAFAGAILAKVENEAVGYALYYPNFSSFRGERGLFLEDLYVKQQWRGLKIGHKLIEAVAIEGSRQNACRLDFLVLSWNQNALNFYNSLGAEHEKEDLHLKIRSDAFKSLVASGR